jgi:dipeptidase D
VVTQGLSPQKLWHFFEALSAIPRASGNEGEVIRYLKRFAREHDVEYSVDEAGNVVMRRPVEKRQGGKPVVVVQSHVDMVCEKNDSTHHDFDRDPLQLKREGEWLRAEHTSLGADNGIGVAAMLALLADPVTEPWPIEYLFTVEEEIGLNGARALDAAMIQGKMLINLDTEEVGTLYIGCAGGRDSDLIFPMSMNPRDRDLDYFAVEVGGLRGGHSGAEIHLGSANAIKLLARILKNLQESLGARLVSIHGGDKDNAIPREACAVIGLSRGDVHRAREIYDRVTAEMRGSMVTVDPGLTFHMNPQPNGQRSFDMQTSTRLIDALMVIPHGVLSMSSVMEDLVETSNNLSSIRTDGEEVRVHASHRSSVAHALSWVAEMHRSIASLSGAAIEQDEGYPGWNPDPESRLLRYASDAVEKVSGKPPSVKAIHAGLECGVIKEKVEGMDAVSMGPTIVGPHSPDERVHVESVKTFWDILVQTLTLIYSDRR